jgi:gamma-glutamylcyclotransferase (GGCT)/AIG2-like uncharacterized protein YtfP
MVGMGEPAAVFVYGTLKRGEINHGVIAPDALSVEEGAIRGRLFDVGEFPGLAAGHGDVHGEIVRFEREALERILPVLDRLEGCLPEDEASSMYYRRVVDVVTSRGTEKAFAYFYNDSHPSVPSLDLLRPLKGGRWSGTDSIASVGSQELEAYRDHVRRFAHDP